MAAFGPIYFIRYNRHAGFDEKNTNFPFYKTSNDQEFIAACDSLLADKLVTLQWWEEDRAKDGFYVIDPGGVENAVIFLQISQPQRVPAKRLIFTTGQTVSWLVCGKINMRH